MTARETAEARVLRLRDAVITADTQDVVNAAARELMTAMDAPDTKGVALLAWFDVVDSFAESGDPVALEIRRELFGE